jgi:hypothetical protein
LNATTFVRGTDHRAQRVEVHPMVARQRADEEPRAPRQRELLPGDEVGVVLERRDDDLVALANVGVAPRRRHEVERLRRAAREYQAVRVGHAEELGDALACGVIAVRRPRRQRVGAAMRVRVVVLVVRPHRVEHDSRLLRRRRRIEVVQLRVRGQEREVGASWVSLAHA